MESRPCSVLGATKTAAGKVLSVRIMVLNNFSGCSVGWRLRGSKGSKATSEAKAVIPVRI